MVAPSVTDFRASEKQMSDYPQTQLFIDGAWRDGSNGRLSIVNPATDQIIGTVANAGRDDLEAALTTAASGFDIWRQVSAFDRAKLLHKAAQLLRDRVEKIATIMTIEQGKPIAESRAETLGAADIIDWFAEEARRAYGRVVPPRFAHVRQIVVKEPVGPVAAFSPWNFPLNQAVRKAAASLAAGCSIILKGPEETPASCAELVHAFADAGLPAGAFNLVYGNPADISNHLIAHPIVRKITFTGSTAVGKQLAALAGAHMKRMTMELGGHAPAIVFDDADVDVAVRILSGSKFRNAGQVCVAPTPLPRPGECLFQVPRRLRESGRGHQGGQWLGRRGNNGASCQRKARRSHGSSHGGRHLPRGEDCDRRGKDWNRREFLQTHRAH
jgi:succinate-semialdehyde dehydrogenase/glutarate-semialdehyde dehydrogenase